MCGERNVIDTAMILHFAAAQVPRRTWTCFIQGNSIQTQKSIVFSIWNQNQNKRSGQKEGDAFLLKD